MNPWISLTFLISISSCSFLAVQAELPNSTGNVSASRTEVPTGTPTWTTTAPDDELSSPLSPLANERALFKDLFEQYEKNLRPNYNSSEPLKVELGLSLRRIEFLDEERQTLLFHGTTRMRWRDQRLTWNQQEYDRVQDIAYSSYALWVPDIRLANRADALGEKTFEHVLANVFYDGQVLLSSPSAYKVYCGMDFGQWPNDLQSCVIEFESFTYDGTRVDLQLMGNNQSLAVEIYPYASINEWHVISMIAEKQVKKYECCPGDYHSVYFVIRLQRHQPFYRPLILTPIILTIFASWLLFLLPLQSSVKFIVGTIELVFVTSFAIFLKSYLPPSLDVVPHIVTLTLNTMVLILLSLFLQVFLQWMSRLKCHMPVPLRTLFLDGLGRVCCVKQSSAYSKNTMHVTVEAQEVDHFEMNDGGEALITEKSRQEWLTLSRILNRVAFVIHVAVSFIVML